MRKNADTCKYKNSKKAKLVQELALEDGSSHHICIQSTWNPNCFCKEKIALKEKLKKIRLKKKIRKFEKSTICLPLQAEEKSETKIFRRREKKHFFWKILKNEPINLAESRLINTTI